MNLTRLFSTLAAVAAVGCISFAQPPREVDIHDPAMAMDGKAFYLYSTGPGVPVYSSNDRIHWQARGQIFSEAPSWTHSITPRFNGHIWAPDVFARGGKYYLYYSISGFGKNDSAIGVAVNSTLDPSAPGYKWEDRGAVVHSVAGRDDWNAIDPNVIADDKGTLWMAFGSFWSGIKLVKLNADGTALAEAQEWHSIAARPRPEGTDVRDPGAGQIEGPFLFHKNGYYYLFVSTGLCCRGKASTYRIAVGRASDITGPYLDQDGRDMMKGGGTPLIADNKAWAGWGGNGVYSVGAKDYVVMHAYEAADNDFHRLKVLPIAWDAKGWPSIDPRALDSFHAYLSN
jgi:arabinan endo-1,5-alpha-L-arabinosidase